MTAASVRFQSDTRGWELAGSKSLRIFAAAVFSLAFYGTLALEGSADAHLGCLSVSSITGNGNDNILEGDGGGDSSHDHEDHISGQGGRDQILGYTCADELLGNEGADHVHGASGHDTLWGGSGDDHFDFCSIMGYCAELVGGNGNDFASGQDNTDFVEDVAESDVDEMRGGNGNNDFVITLDGDGADVSAGDDGGLDTCRRDNGDTQGGGCELN